MDVIVHRIRLRPGVAAESFERWVREVDYASCPDLPSVLSFSVQRVSADPAAPLHFFEVIAVRDRAAFDRDMATATFDRLVADFDRMAVVVDECAGERIEPGYALGPAALDRAEHHA